MHANILIIEAERELRDQLCGRLASSEHEVRAVDGGIDALAAIATRSPDIIILSASISYIDGYEVSRHLKNTDDTRFIPIIMMSESDDPEDKSYAYSIGVDEYLVKPVDLDDMSYRVDKLLRVRWLYKNLLDENQELQAAYDESREKEAFYNAAFYNLPIASFIIDPDQFVITAMNESAAQLTNYDSGALTGGIIGRLCPDTDWLTGICKEAASQSKVRNPADETRSRESDRAQTAPSESIRKDGEILINDGVRVPVEASASLMEYRNRTAVALSIVDCRSRDASVRRLIQTERLSMLREMAIAVNSKVNDPLFVILNDIASLTSSLSGSEQVTLSKLSRVLEAAQRIQRVTAQLSAINNPVSRDYLPGVRMLDLDESVGTLGDTNEEQL